MPNTYNGYSLEEFKNLKEKDEKKDGKFKLTVILAPAKKNGPSVETDWPLTIACHMKEF